MTERKNTAPNKKTKRDGREKLLTANGKTMSRIAWARHLGISGTALDNRLKRNPVEVALSKHRRKLKKSRPNSETGLRLITAFGKTMPRIAWARFLGISCGALDYRLKHHPKEIALSKDFMRIVVRNLKARGFWNKKRKITSEKSLANLRRNAKKATKAAMAKVRRYTLRGETHTVSEWARILGLKKHTLDARLRVFSPEEALTSASLKHLAGIPRSKRHLRT